MGAEAPEQPASGEIRQPGRDCVDGSPEYDPSLSTPTVPLLFPVWRAEAAPGSDCCRGGRRNAGEDLDKLLPDLLADAQDLEIFVHSIFSPESS